MLNIPKLLEEIAKTYTQMAPYLLLGLFFAGILHVLFKREFIMRHLGGNSFGSVFKAALLGVPLPLCSCGVVPTALSLRKNKASEGATIAFLISTPQTGVDSIIATDGMLGPVFAIFRPLAAFIMGIAGGVVTNLFSTEEKTTKAPSRYSFSCSLCMETTPHSHTVVQKGKRIFTYAFGEFLDGIAFHLVVGIIISGLIAYIMPPDFFSRYVGNTFVEMLIMMIGGIPLYICATASIPIAATLMLKGLSPGAAFVFLATGPVTNAASLAIIYAELGRKVTIIYLSVIAITSMLAGFILNAIGTTIPVEVTRIHIHHHAANSLFSWNDFFSFVFAITLLLSFYRLYLKPLIRRLLSGKKKAPAGSPAGKTFFIEGMTCKNCVKRVTEALYSVNGITTVEVSLPDKCAKVKGVFNEMELGEKVDKAGFKVNNNSENQGEKPGNEPFHV